MTPIFCFIGFIYCMARLMQYVIRVARHGGGLLRPDFSRAFDILEDQRKISYAPVTFWGKASFIASYYLTLLMAIGLFALLAVTLMSILDIL